MANKTEEIIETDFSTLGEVICNPNGKGFYLLANEKGKQFQIWHLSYPEKELTRVTSDSNAYRNIEVSKDGTKLSANRLDMFSNVWVVPNGDKNQAKKMTKGENEIGGLLTLHFTPDNKILFNGRRNSIDVLWTINIEGTQVNQLADEKMGLLHHFGFSKDPVVIFYEFENHIWKMKPDGTNLEKLDLGQAKSFSSPSVSPDDKWLYYVKRDD